MPAEKPVTVTFTGAQARVVQAALSLYLDLSEDEDDRVSNGITGTDRNTAWNAHQRLMRAWPL